MDKRTADFALISAVVLLLDQLTKYSVAAVKPSGTGFFSINYATNTGAAFGMFRDGNTFLILLSFVVLAAIIYILFFYSKNQPKGVFIFSALLFGGTLGNLADRILRGYVVDFIDFSFWPSFNAADTAITIGVIGLIYYIYKE
ncbi:MAG TPA: signal peptidase II [Candidatus Nanoarchaeia archaeon]|nr:signal peptidase II [Candidatus Nanoarchaeia archaeon]